MLCPGIPCYSREQNRVDGTRRRPNSAYYRMLPRRAKPASEWTVFEHTPVLAMLVFQVGCEVRAQKKHATQETSHGASCARSEVCCMLQPPPREFTAPLSAWAPYSSLRADSGVIFDLTRVKPGSTPGEAVDNSAAET